MWSRLQHAARSMWRTMFDLGKGVYDRGGKYLCNLDHSIKGKYDRNTGVIECYVDGIPIPRFFKMKSISSYDPVTGRLSGVATEFFPQIGGGGGHDEGKGEGDGDTKGGVANGGKGKNGGGGGKNGASESGGADGGEGIGGHLTDFFDQW